MQINNSKIFNFQKESKQAKEVFPIGMVEHPYNLTTIKGLDQAIHSKAIAFKSVTATGIGFNIFSNGELTPGPKWLTQANQFESFQTVLSLITQDFIECGNAYLEVVRNTAGTIVELYWIPAETIWIEPKRKSFVQTVGIEDVNLSTFGFRSKTQSEVVHFKNSVNKNAHYGTPDWLGAIGAISLDISAVEYNYNFFLNNGIPSTAIIVRGGEFSPSVEKDIKDFLQNNFLGLANSHKTLYLPIKSKDVEVEFTMLNKREKDGAYVKLREQLQKDIVSAHGVPPRLLGIIEGGSLGGGGEAEQQMKIFKETVIAPIHKTFETQINNTILAETNETIVFNKIKVETPAGRLTELVTIVESGIMTEDEARKELGLSVAEN